MKNKKLLLLLPVLLALSACGGDDESAAESPAAPEKKPYMGKMNISRFVYRDVNRNGRYDMADRPYAGQAIRITRPDDTMIQRQSNIAGFTNFKMSRDNDRYPIHSAGEYQVTTLPDETMVVTSGNEDTTLSIESLDGSPGGLIADPTLVPLGVAPKLTVSGSIYIKDGDSATYYSLTTVAPDGTETELSLSEEGIYQFQATPGEWRIKTDRGDESRERRFTVSDQAIQLSGEDFRRPATPPLADGPVRTADFDDLSTSDTLYEIPNGYAGLDWHNWISTHHKLYKGPGYINNTTSGEYLAYNSSGHPAEIYSERPFNLIDLYIGVAWNSAERGTISVRGWRGDEMVYEDILKGSVSRPLHFLANYRNVTRVEIASSQYWQVVVDDLRYNRD